jgi:hypothetical protein
MFPLASPFALHVLNRVGKALRLPHDRRHGLRMGGFVAVAGVLPAGHRRGGGGRRRARARCPDTVEFLKEI